MTSSGPNFKEFKNRDMLLKIYKINIIITQELTYFKVKI